MNQGIVVSLSAQAIITAAAILAAATAIGAAIVKVVKWFIAQRQQTADIAALKEEQCLLTYGVLACLKGLQEQGCDASDLRHELAFAVADTCVCCGEPVPEGRMVCPVCEERG